MPDHREEKKKDRPFFGGGRLRFVEVEVEMHASNHRFFSGQVGNEEGSRETLGGE